MSAYSLMGWQCLYILSMFLGTFISYLIPILVINRQKKSSIALVGTGGHTQRVLSACNCLSAGIFLGICFLNLIPYVDQEFSELFAEVKYETNFPVGMFSVILGLFLVLTLETLVLKCKANGDSSSAPVLHLDDEELNNDFVNEEQRQELLDVTNKEPNEYSGVNGNGAPEHNHMHSHSHSINVHNTSSSTLSFFILMFATSVHSLFEGLALGLQTDSIKAMHLFIGIILHECLVAVALGLNSARIDCSLKLNIRFAIVFSLTIPVGIAMGVMLGYTPGLFGHTISAIFQGLAAGTFIHVTFHELIPHEFLSAQNDSKLLKILLLFVGFNLIAFMTLFTDSHQ